MNAYDQAKAAIKALKPIKHRFNWRINERVSQIKKRVKSKEPLETNDIQYLFTLYRVFTHPNWEKITSGEHSSCRPTRAYLKD